MVEELGAVAKKTDRVLTGPGLEREPGKPGLAMLVIPLSGANEG